MNIIDRLKQRAKENKKTIVLPETMDIRVLEYNFNWRSSENKRAESKFKSR